jgi:asparagine synthase (glutamine-hydrolysing)
MCGIAGLIELDARSGADALERRARAMAEALAHRGPDDSGVWTDAEAGIVLAHRRLSIIDLSPEGHQPMVSADGRWVMTYNGEIYNFPELRAELEAAGARFRGRSDSEVFLEAVARLGLDVALARAAGMFAIGLWDRRERTLHLVRDRLGVKPLAWAFAGRTFLFGSELNALRADSAFDRAPDPEAVALYLARACVPAPFTIHKAARKLMPGHVLSLGPDGEPRIRAYWSLADVAEAGQARRFEGTDEEALDALDAELARAVSGRMLADVPLGVFLSGGLDSSLVAATMARLADRPIETFSIGYEDAAYDEGAAAAEVARALGANHHPLTVTPAEAMSVVPELARIYDEPFADSSGIPTYLVAKLARGRVTVALSGDGGDELFGGYNRHAWVSRLEAVPRLGRRAAAGALTALSPAAWDALAGAVSPALPAQWRLRNPGDKAAKLARVLAAEDGTAMYRGLAAREDLAAQLAPGLHMPQTLLSTAGGGPRLDDPTERMMALDALTYLPDDILVKVDRASMAVGLEAREPLLDHRLASFAFRLPPGLKVRNGRGKWPLRALLARHLPPALFERPKMGFAVPIADWLRGPLRPWAEELLSPAAVAATGWLDPGAVSGLWARHLSGRDNLHHELWTALMLQDWMRRAGGA